jgi:hypothetical protein
MISRRSILTCAALLIVLAVALRSPVDAQPSSGMGLVVAVDLERKTLELETAGGPRMVLPLTAATILDDHGRALPLAQIKPGDAVSYEATAGSATSLRVARQFWAVPTRW